MEYWFYLPPRSYSAPLFCKPLPPRFIGSRFGPAPGHSRLQGRGVRHDGVPLQADGGAR